MKPLSHRGEWRFALGFLVTCLLGFGFLGYSQTSPGPALPEGEAQPTSQPRGGTPPALSVRLLERIEQSPGGTYGPSQFGSAIALNGDTLAVGASERYAVPGHQKGAVFVYQREGDGWDRLQADLMRRSQTRHPAAIALRNSGASIPPPHSPPSPQPAPGAHRATGRTGRRRTRRGP